MVVHSEIGASTAILDAGYNLDCLMMRYQGLQWGSEAARDHEWPCNEGLNPLQPHFNDGIDVNPFEVMFVKVKAAFLEAGWSHAASAATFAEWTDAVTQGGDQALLAVQRNRWFETGADALLEDAKRRGQLCFDVEFYLDANKYDLGHFREMEDPAGEAWDQFLRMAVFEGRPHRWKC